MKQQNNNNRQLQALLRSLKPKPANLRASLQRHGMRMDDSDLSQMSSVQDDADQRSLERSIQETAAWNENHEPPNYQKHLRYDGDKCWFGQMNLSPNREHLPHQTPTGVGLPPGWTASGIGHTNLRSSKFGQSIKQMCQGPVNANKTCCIVSPTLVVPTSGMSKAEIRRARKALKALESNHTGNAASFYEQRIDHLVKPSRVRPKGNPHSHVQKYIGYSNRLIVSIAGTAESLHEQHWNHLAMPLKVTQQVSGMQMYNHCCTHSNWTLSPIRSMNFHMQMCRNLKGRGTVMIQPKGIKSLIPVGSWLSVATY